MMSLEGSNICVVDLETLYSAEDCRFCFAARALHYPWEDTSFQGHCPTQTTKTFKPIGWDDKSRLSLSIGCWFDSRDSRMHWFDVHTLEATIRHFVDTQPLLVSFNGIAFDFPLMRGLLRQCAEALNDSDPGTAVWLEGICDAFQTLCATSYDLLAEIWQVDPARKFERGLHSLDAISQANGLGAKAMTGAQAPRLWQEGRYAEVLNYCQGDVRKTKALFELICAGKPILRGDGKPMTLPPPPQFSFA